MAVIGSLICYTIVYYSKCIAFSIIATQERGLLHTDARPHGHVDEGHAFFWSVNIYVVGQFFN